MRSGAGRRSRSAGVEVSGVPAVHNGFRDRHHGGPIEPLGYLVSAGRRTIYFPGDTDLFPGMSDFGQVDVALLPVWGWGTAAGEGHLDPPRAARAVEMIRPRLALPIHWGSFFPVGLRRFRPQFLTRPPLYFAEMVSRLAPEVEVRILQPGSGTTLEDG